MTAHKHESEKIKKSAGNSPARGGQRPLGLYIRLAELMTAKGMKVHELEELSGVSHGTISRLRRNQATSIELDHLAAICRVLGVTPADILRFHNVDLWYPIRLRRHVTIHVGSSAVTGTLKGAADTENGFRETVGSFDVYAMAELIEFIGTLEQRVRVRVALHATGEGETFAQLHKATADSILEDGNCHIVLASPRANSLAEEVVSLAYGVPPSSLGMQDRFPLAFAWDESRQGEIVSSFATFVPEDQCGIVDTSTGKLVARRTRPVAATAIGEDCGLIFVQRVPISAARRTYGAEEEGIVIALLGHGGPATLGAARVIMSPEAALALYPDQTAEPQLHAVKTTYQARDGATPRDNRRLLTWALAEDEG